MYFVCESVCVCVAVFNIEEHLFKSEKNNTIHSEIASGKMWLEAIISPVKAWHTKMIFQKYVLEIIKTLIDLNDWNHYLLL